MPGQWVEQYLDDVATLLGTDSGGVFAGDPAIRFTEDRTYGWLRAELQYHPSGNRLHIFLAVSVSGGAPEWRRYGFHSRGPDGRRIFTYDNAPHHPELPAFPDHKHTGERAIRGCSRPSIRDVLTEALALSG
jgi:hypothetical protein